MELRQLRYFVAVAESLNFRRAAERLNLSQPPLTVAIRKLEHELGTALFVRGSKGVTLSEAGRVALDVAYSTLAGADRFKLAVREADAGERGRLRIGFVGSATFELLPRIIPAFRRTYPSVELALEEATSTEIARKVAMGEIDVGLVRLPLMEAAAVETMVIDRDELHAAVLKDGPHGRAKMIALECLAATPFIIQARVSVLHATTLAACHEAGFVPMVAQEATQLSAILALVRSRLGVALVPARAASSIPNGVRLIPLERRVPTEAGIAVARDRETALIRNFVAISCDSDLLSKP